MVFKASVGIAVTCFVLSTYLEPARAESLADIPPHFTRNLYSPKLRRATDNQQDINADLRQLKDQENNNINCTECGISHSEQIKYRVINGAAVEPVNKYPWMVAIYLNGYIHCGGAIINKHYVLTAAHCFDNYPSEQDAAGDVTVAFLSPHLKPSLRLTKLMAVSTITYHEDYKDYDTESDVALLKLSEPIRCGPFASPICLPGDDVSIDDEDEYIVAGWGRNEGETEEVLLREANITRVHPDECRKASFLFTLSEEKTFCMNSELEQTICVVDEGGPMFRLIDGRYYAIGIAKGVLQMGCRMNVPFIFTSVLNFLDWIRSETGMESP